jgi:Arc/MetJ-type ribon-helix-helix transcriptional regulator
LVASGQFSSRSEAVRAGIDRLVDDARRAKAAAAILAGYQRLPETADELDSARKATVTMIAEEPW